MSHPALVLPTAFSFGSLQGFRVIHYTGHGYREHLAFEDGFGEMHPLHTDNLGKLVHSSRLADTNEIPTKLVFLAACHSEDAGHAFAKAGIEHVVAIRKAERVSDFAGQLFMQEFYTVLFIGKTVRQAFDSAKNVVQSGNPKQRGVQNEHSKFMLLPEDGNHDAVLFPNLPQGTTASKGGSRALIIVSVDYSPDFPRAEFETIRSHARCELGTTKKIYTEKGPLIESSERMRPCAIPSHSTFFRGRHVDMEKIVKNILEHRRLVLVGCCCGFWTRPLCNCARLVCVLC